MKSQPNPYTYTHMVSTPPNPTTAPLNHIDEIMESHRQPYRWVMLVLVWLLYISFGIVSRSAAPLVTPMIRDLNISFGQMGFVLGSWQLTYIGFAAMAGAIMDKWGIRKSMFSGALVISLSVSLRFFSQGFWSLLLFVALFGIGGPMISIGAPKTIATWFKGKDRGTAVGIYSTGPRIGGIVSLAMTNSVVMPLVGQNWRLAFVCYGVVMLLFGLLWWWLSREIVAADGSERFSTLRVLSSLIKVHNVRIILVSGLLSFTMMHGYTNWLPKILENAGMSPITAGVSSALPLFASIPVVLLLPRWVPARNRGRAIAVLSAIAGFSIVWVVVFQLPVYAGLLLFGLSGTCIFPLLVLSLMETPEVAERHMGSATGVFFCIAEIGGFLGPFVVGSLVDVTESFSAGALFLAVLGLIIVMCMLLLKPPPETF